jgi:adenosylhomocysteine nucleosidase
MKRVALLAPMTHELAPLVARLGLRRDGAWHRGAAGGVEVAATLIGIGPRLAHEGTERVLAGGGFDRVVVVGIAGGVGASRIGDLVVPERVVDLASGASFVHRPLGDAPARGTLVTAEGLLTDPAFFAGLAAEGVLAIDMETAAVAAACEAHGLPWSAIRAISDIAGDPVIDPAVFGLAGADGRTSPARFLRFALAKPRRLLALPRLARGMHLAMRTATEETARALAAIGATG